MKRHELNDEVRLRGIGMFSGESLANSVCPICHGGMTIEKSFSISRIDSGFVYNCFRVTCTAQGFTSEKATKQLVQTNSDDEEHKTKPSNSGKGRRSSRTRSNFPHSTINLSSEQHTFLMDKFLLTFKELGNAGIRWCPETFSYVIPIWDKNGFKAGVIDRSWSGRNPKAINHWSSNASNLYYPNPSRSMGQTGPIAIVEDVFSCIKVNRYIPCVALLGTNLGDKEAAELRTLSHRLVFALLPDATDKSLKLSNH